MSITLADAPRRKVMLGPPEMTVDKRADGSMLCRSPRALGAFHDKNTDCLDLWAEKTPDHIYLAQRDASGQWQTISYREALSAARGIAAALLARNLSAERPIVMLTPNDLGQALLGLAANYVGIPFAPISPAYSTVSQDFGKLRIIFSKLGPGLVYATQAAPIARAIDAVVPKETELVVAVQSDGGRPATLLGDLMSTAVTNAVAATNAIVGPDTIAKFLFTSGSTGVPKAVINTQRMICSNQAMFRISTPMWVEGPPVLVDWLPWSHTFGGNHNFYLALFNGGSFYIDGGKPLPGGIEETVRNLKDIAPTVYFNVPRGFEMLVPYLKSDAALAKTFFSRLQCIHYAGASLSQPVWDGLMEASVAACGERVHMMSGLGSTETSPGAITVVRAIDRAGTVGVPMPGITLKLVPNTGKLEARLKGPNITPGYWKDDDKTREAFDDEGFYTLGDALKFIDPSDPSQGFAFDGRVAEDFKLSTGTWVSVGPLRAILVRHFAPYIRDAVIAGTDKPTMAVLLLPEIEPLRARAGLAANATAAEVCAHPAVVDTFATLLAAYDAANKTSSTRIARLALLHEPLSIDAGEVTDKGSVNQRAVLAARSALVAELYADKPSARIIAAI